MSMKGNQFWKNRRLHGRPTIFENSDQLWNSCAEYFEWCEANPIVEQKVLNNQGVASYADLEHTRPFTKTGLCIRIGIGRTTWRDYAKRDEFKEICEYVDEIIYEQKFCGAAVNIFNPSIICRDLGLVEKTATDHSSSDGTMTPKSFNDFYSDDAMEMIKKPVTKKAAPKKTES